MRMAAQWARVCSFMVDAGLDVKSEAWRRGSGTRGGFGGSKEIDPGGMLNSWR